MGKDTGFLPATQSATGIQAKFVIQLSLNISTNSAYLGLELVLELVHVLELLLDLHRKSKRENKYSFVTAI